MKKLLTFLMMSVLAIGVGWADEVTMRRLTQGTTGELALTTLHWSGETFNSAAVYAGQVLEKQWHPAKVKQQALVL